MYFYYDELMDLVNYVRTYQTAPNTTSHLRIGKIEGVLHTLETLEILKKD